MSLQVFLYGKIPGADEFLRNADDDFDARAQWVTLLSEVLPRALLAELGLSRMLLGSSGGDQFLVVLPQEFRERAALFCDKAGAAVSAYTSGAMRVVYSFTENLGDWSDIRKRLLIELGEQSAHPLARTPDSLSTTVVKPQPRTENLQRGNSIKLSDLLPGFEDRESWALGDDIPFADHAALNDEGNEPASPDALATRADGRWIWGVLRGDVDAFTDRLRRANSVEEHIQLSTMYKQFMVSELQMRCSLPEFWRSVRILYASGQSFAVIGAWDALIGLAREMQRIFSMFVDSNLRDLAGTEGKTISMAIALAPDESESVAGVYADAGERLELAKAAGRDSVWVLGRTLDWKQLADAAESRTTMVRLIRDFGAPRNFLEELGAFYRASTSDTIVTPGARRTNTRVEKPWRFYRRLNAVLAPSGRSRDYQRLRSDLIGDFTGRRASNIQLRPQGRVALEWARLETGSI